MCIRDRYREAGAVFNEEIDSGGHKNIYTMQPASSTYTILFDAISLDGKRVTAMEHITFGRPNLVYCTYTSAAGEITTFRRLLVHTWRNLQTRAVLWVDEEFQAECSKK